MTSNTIVSPFNSGIHHTTKPLAVEAAERAADLREDGWHVVHIQRHPLQLYAIITYREPDVLSIDEEHEEHDWFNSARKCNLIVEAQ